jgi:hypothetical protein
MAFLQYKTETIPGKPLKRKVTQEETRERKKQYEKEWERKFINSWKQDRRPLASSQRWTKCYAGASKPLDQKSYIYILL